MSLSTASKRHRRILSSRQHAHRLAKVATITCGILCQMEPWPEMRANTAEQYERKREARRPPTNRAFNPNHIAIPAGGYRKLSAVELTRASGFPGAKVATSPNEPSTQDT